MTRLTPETVRARAIALALLVALTFALVVLGLIYFSTSPWFWIVATIFDLPIWIIVALSERAERSAS